MKKKNSILRTNALVIVIFALLLIASGAYALDTTGLVAYWAFDETAGTSFDDKIGTLDFNSFNVTANQTGKIGKAVQDINGYLATPASTSVNPSAYTFCGWFKPNANISSTSDANWFGSTINTAENIGWEIFKNDGATNPKLTVRAVNGGYAYGTENPFSLTSGTWYFICGSLGAAGQKSYKNASSAMTATAQTTYTGAGGSSSLVLGNWSAREISINGHFNGMIDEVALFSRQLSDAEITEFYNAGAGLTYCSGAFTTSCSVTLNTSLTAPALDVNFVGAGNDINFNVLYTGSLTPGMKLYYSVNPGQAGNLIINDTNLLDGTTITCADYNFKDSTACSYDFNAANTILEKFYYIDANLEAGADGNFMASSNRFKINAYPPATTFSYNQLTNRSDANISLTCADNNTEGTASGCKYVRYRLDSNATWNDVNVQVTNPYIFQTSGLGVGAHTIYYQSQDNVDNNEAVTSSPITITADTIAPTVIFTIVNANGFVSNFDVNYSLTCYDDRNDLMNYDVNINDTNNVYHAQDYNAKTKTGTANIGQGAAQFTGICTDASGNTATVDANLVYALKFRLINEDTRAVISFADLNGMVSTAQAYSYDGNNYYDFIINSASNINFLGNSNVIRFDFTYRNDLNTKLSREIDFNYLADDNNINVCLAPFQTFYEQIFVSSQNKPVVLVNDFADCYNLVSSTKYAYENALATKAYTVNKPYYLYTYSNEVKSLLALLEGTTASVMNIDAIQFNAQEYNINLAYDTVVFEPLLNEITGEYDTNTIKIFYKSLAMNNTALSLKIYLDSIVLWQYDEDTNVNALLVNFYYGDLGITDANLLKLVITKTITGGEQETLTQYFNTSGSTYAGLLDPILSVMLAFVIVFTGLTIVAYRYALGWFGIVIICTGIGILAMAPGYWYVRFAQAVLIIMLVFTILVFKEETVKVV